MPAHNEENRIKNCLKSLMEMDISREIDEVEYIVVDDRCEDKTALIAESMGARVLKKEIRRDYASAIADAVAYGIENTDGELILKCDADIIAPQNGLKTLFLYLNEDIGRVSSEVKTRTGKWWINLLMWFRDINYRITPLGEAPRGAFTLFRRKVVEEIGGFDKNKPTWDTAFDIRLKNAGYKVMKIREVTALEFRENLTIRRIIKRQIRNGRERRRLGISFWRTLLHSILRGRIFVLYGYIKEIISK